MKRKIIPFAFFQLVLIVSSCGVNTKDWTKIELGFECKNVSSANIHYQRNENEYASYLEGNIFLTTSNDICELIEIIKSFPIKKDIEKSIDSISFATKIEITFAFDKLYKTNDDKLWFFEYGISDSKVILNNGDIHYLPGRIDIIYENFLK